MWRDDYLLQCVMYTAMRDVLLKREFYYLLYGISGMLIG